MNLFLALFWFLCAIGLFAFEQIIGPAGFRLRLGGGNFSVAWLMLVMAAYNLRRWWRYRTYREEQRNLWVQRAIRKGGLRRRRSEPAEPPNPDFNFTDQPPPAD